MSIHIFEQWTCESERTRWIALLLVACQSGNSRLGRLFLSSATRRKVFCQAPQLFLYCNFSTCFYAGWMSELHQSPAGEQDWGHDLRNQCFSATMYYSRGMHNCVCVTPFIPISVSFSYHPCAFSSITGGQHEQHAGAGEWCGAVPVRPSTQLHGCGDRERRAVRCHSHRLLWPWPCHIPQPGWHATSPDRPVQLEMAQWYSNFHTTFLGTHWKVSWCIFSLAFSSCAVVNAFLSPH